mmetsp:Transcript_23424/g.74648  ORF Transcript_23424/g.74648 Transcript_23424/m.74648 type:complete len:213 (-) Transcript_23424:547-1185(-)
MAFEDDGQHFRVTVRVDRTEHAGSLENEYGVKDGLVRVHNHVLEVARRKYLMLVLVPHDRRRWVVRHQVCRWAVPNGRIIESNEGHRPLRARLDSVGDEDLKVPLEGLRSTRPQVVHLKVRRATGLGLEKVVAFALFKLSVQARQATVLWKALRVTVGLEHDVVLVKSAVGNFSNSLPMVAVGIDMGVVNVQGRVANHLSTGEYRRQEAADN